MISAVLRQTVAERRCSMKSERKITARKQPLPDQTVSRNARHGKTADDLPEQNDLPLTMLKKSIPETDLHDM